MLPPKGFPFLCFSFHSSFLSLFPLISLVVLLPAFVDAFFTSCHQNVPSLGGREGSLRSRQGSLMFSFVADQMRVQHALPARRYTAKEALGRQTDGHNVSINLAKKT